MDNSKVYLRANGDMLKEIRGQNVCLLGKCVKVIIMIFELINNLNKLNILV